MKKMSITQPRLEGCRKPRSSNERGSTGDQKQRYLFPLLDALRGLIFVFEVEEALTT
jgi:hypothetical protein